MKLPTADLDARVADAVAAIRAQTAVTPHLGLTLGSGHMYEQWGLLSGSVYGALGGLWASRRTLVAPIAVGLAFVFEPLVVFLLVRAGMWGGGGLLDHALLWMSEVAIGLAAIAYVVIRTQVAGERRPEHAA